MKNAFDGLRLILYVVVGIFGLMFFLRSCSDNYALRTSPQEDFLIITGTFDKKVTRGRFQGYSTKRYVAGRLASGGNTLHNMSYSDACRYIDCDGLTDGGLFSLKKRKGNSISYRVPVWSANKGKTIVLRKPGSKKVDMRKSDGNVKGGLLLLSVFVLPLLLLAIFGGRKKTN